MPASLGPRMDAKGQEWRRIAEGVGVGFWALAGAGCVPGWWPPIQGNWGFGVLLAISGKTMTKAEELGGLVFGGFKDE
ncbi:MAG: hypothetical protein RI897_1982 [Verrucomicrobiota bacterium]